VPGSTRCISKLNPTKSCEISAPASFGLSVTVTGDWANDLPAIRASAKINPTLLRGKEWLFDMPEILQNRLSSASHVDARIKAGLAAHSNNPFC
jgi:hypothetical protein